jgi:hypothetical protein
MAIYHTRGEAVWIVSYRKEARDSGNGIVLAPNVYIHIRYDHPSILLVYIVRQQFCFLLVCSCIRKIRCWRSSLDRIADERAVRGPRVQAVLSFWMIFIYKHDNDIAFWFGSYFSFTMIILHHRRSVQSIVEVDIQDVILTNG